MNKTFSEKEIRDTYDTYATIGVLTTDALYDETSDLYCLQGVGAEYSDFYKFDMEEGGTEEGFSEYYDYALNNSKLFCRVEDCNQNDGAFELLTVAKSFSIVTEAKVVRQENSEGWYYVDFYLPCVLKANEHDEAFKLYKELMKCCGRS